MSKEIKMPQLSDTMDKGKILSWNKKEGDKVNRGDILAEVETDKANLEIESFDEGVLLKIVTPVNSMANVGDVIAVIGNAGEKAETSNISNKPKPNFEQNGQAATALENSQPIKETMPNPAIKIEFVGGSQESSRIKASPLAKKMAAEFNLDLKNVRGTGPAGRIVKRDLEQNTVNNKPAIAATKPAMPRIDNTAIASGLSSLSKMREAIAMRMSMSTSIPHFYSTVAVDMSQAKNLREVLKNKSEYTHITINHLIIKAAAYALSKATLVNCSYKDGQLYNPGAINIGIITAVEDGLLIPVVKNANQLSLSELAVQSNELINRARQKKPRPDDLMGGTFSISNMGMYGIDSFTAIINPGQGAVLAVSATKDCPVVTNAEITIKPMMNVTLSVDHRIIDGLVAANFLNNFKEALENPGLMHI